MDTRSVEKSNGCWEWNGYRGPKGHGQFTSYGVSSRLAHRVAWEFTNGPVPDGLCVLHRCDNPPCCNPDHLFLGTIADNNRDMFEKGRQQRGEGHYFARFTDAQVREIRARRQRTGEGPLPLAAAYDVPLPTMRDIVYHKTWKHVHV